jgi:osomolarity two-component system sensor histidine kinase NIK1
VKEAMWYLTTVFFLSLFFSIIVALVTAITPLMQWSSFWRYWTTWWLGILATMITVTPLLTHLLSWEYKSHFKNPCKSLECLLVALTTAGVVVIVFFINFTVFRPRAYLCFPVITWTAFRFNRVGWALTVSAVAYCSAVGTIRKRGALYSNQNSLVSSPELILQIQLFACVIGVVGITLAAAVREKKHLTKRLRHWNVELEQRIDTRTAELRKANEELQISQRNAEQASQSKSDFLANMSHEIRTPIHGILGLTALLLESELTCDQKESLVSVKECADLLLHIINSVLDLAKIEAGRLEVENVLFNIRKMASSTFRMLQPRAQQRGLGLLLEIDNGVPHSLVGDVGKLQQCLLNLVGNALKFTHKGSVSVHVKLAAEQIVSPLDTDNDLGNKVVGRSSFSLGNSKRFDLLQSMFLEFEVRDTGIGISQETLQDMFKPFTQADASTSRLYGGTGLGLCIVQRFVDLLGGTLWAESVVGKGSAFHFRLPFYLNKPKESPPESPRLKPDNSFRQWSLMGGLTFNPASKQQPSEVNQEGPETRTPKVRSASDLKQLSEEANGHVEDFEAVTPAQVSEGPKRRDRLRGSGSDDQRSLEHAFSDPLRATNGDSVRSDRSASSEVTASGQVEIIQPLLSHTSSTLSDWGERSALGKPREQGPFDSSEALERERGRAAANAPSPARSDLSRESSADLDSMIKNKVSLEILLAEDNAINQKIASRQLEKHGHKVTIVGDGKQALDLVFSRHDSFDLVLMDVQMPVMDGLMATELIRKAESENGWTRLPVLGLTAHAIQGYQDTCLRHGMDGYLGKPFEIHQLLKTIGHLLPPDKLGHRA